MRRNENLEELIVAAVEMKVQERMLSSTTGSRLKKREREAFQEKEEKKQMMNSYDRQIAKLTEHSDRLELKLSVWMKDIKEYFGTGKQANNATLPGLDYPAERSIKEPILVTQLQEILDEDERLQVSRKDSLFAVVRGMLQSPGLAMTTTIGNGKARASTVLAAPLPTGIGFGRTNTLFLPRGKKEKHLPHNMAPSQNPTPSYK